VLNDTANISSWQSIAEGIKTAANSLLWKEDKGMYHDNETTTLTSQDGYA
jgi:neutral trehalase